MLAPIWVEAPVARLFQVALVTVMAPDWNQLPDQPWLIF
jgi:hypothetical protein